MVMTIRQEEGQSTTFAVLLPRDAHMPEADTPPAETTPGTSPEDRCGRLGGK